MQAVSPPPTTLKARVEALRAFVDECGQQKDAAKALKMEPARISRALNDPTDRKLAPIEIAIQQLQSKRSPQPNVDAPQPARSDTDRPSPPASVREALTPYTYLLTYDADTGAPVARVELVPRLTIFNPIVQPAPRLSMDVEIEPEPVARDERFVRDEDSTGHKQNVG